MKKLLSPTATFVLLLLMFPFTSAATVYDWNGSVSSSWTNANNWTVPGFLGLPTTASTPPTSTDDIRIGVVSYTTAPIIIATGTTCASLSFGVLKSSTLTVNGTLSVTGAIKQLPSAVQISILGSNVVTGTLAGTGTVTCASLQAGDLTTLLNVLALSNNYVQFVSTVNTLNVTGNINVYSTTYFLLVVPLGFNNAAFYLRGGTATVGGQISTQNYSTGILALASYPSLATFTVDIPSGSSTNAYLKLTGTIPVDATSLSGSIDFYHNSGGTGITTTEYAGTAAQTIYSNTASLLDHSPSTYQNLTFSAAGQKNIQSGSLLTAGDWSSASGKVDAVTNNPTVIFQGTTQTLTDAGSNSGAGVVFKNVTFQGGGTKTISSGTFSVNDIGILTVTANSALAAGGNLTLISDETGSASVAAIPLGSSITGNVNAQRFIKGSSTSLSKRGYRMMSSPVYTGTVSGNRVFDLSYLLTSIYISGAAGGGFNSPNGNNPTLYIYREDVVQSGTTFTSGPWKGINKINNSPVYNTGTQSRTNKTNTNDTTVNLYIGNGVLLYFIGDKTNNSTQTGTKTTSPFDYPEDVTLTQPGALNTGTVDVRLWFRPDNLLSYTNNSLANSANRGFCFVGNPYACTINWEKFNRASTINQSSIYGANIPDAVTQPAKIWVFNPSSKQFDTYMQKTGTISVADTTTTVNPSSTYTGAASNMIASGQGFFIQATAANQSISFRETAKTTTQATSSNLIQLMGLPKEFKTAAEPVLRFKMRMDSINTDDVVIGFNKNCSTAFINDEDAEDMGGNGALVSLSLLSADSVNLAISREPLPVKTLINPLFVSAKTSGLYSFELTKATDLPALYEVWLMDAFTKDSLDMRANKIYNFNIDKTDLNTFGNKRFSLIIRKNLALGVHLLNFTAKRYGKQVNTAWKVENEFNYTSFVLERSTNGGSTFEPQYSLTSSGLGDYTYTDSSPADGQNIYRLKIIFLDGQISYSKSITVDFSQTNNLANNLNVFPNPTTKSINFMMPADQQGKTPSYNVQIINSSGTLIKKTDSADAHWQKDVSDLNPGTYIIQVTNNKDKSVWGVSKFVKN